MIAYFMAEPNILASTPSRDPYRGVVLVFLGITILGAIASLAGAAMLGVRELAAAAVTLRLPSGVLLGVPFAQAARARPPKVEDEKTAEPATLVLKELPISLWSLIPRMLGRNAEKEVSPPAAPGKVLLPETACRLPELNTIDMIRPRNCFMRCGLDLACFDLQFFS